MLQESVASFSPRAAYYSARQGYPNTVYEWLQARAPLKPHAAVVDAASGAGQSSHLFLRHGHVVYAVEPDAAMRACAEQRLATHPGFHSVAAHAEHTGLPDGLAALIVCASAFHWLDAAAARAEFRRLLAPGASVLIMRNGRRACTSFMREYAALFRRHAMRTGARGGRVGAIRDFFAPAAYVTDTLNWVEPLDYETLAARLLSYATIPLPAEPGHAAMMEELAALFARHATAGRVDYYCELTLHLGTW